MNAPRAPLGCFGATFESARQTLARLGRHRIRWLVLGVLVLLLAGSWMLGSNAHERVTGRHVLCVLLWWVLATVLMPWATIYLGVHGAHGDLEDRTSQYLFVRPVSRVPILLGKWLASAVAGAAISALGVLAIHVGLGANARLFDGGGEGHTSLVFVYATSCGAAAYAACAVLFSAAFRRPLLWSALFVVGLQQLAANLPVSASVRQITIADPMRRLVLAGIDADARLAEHLWPAQRFASNLIGAPLAELAWFTGVCLVLACWIYSRTEYESRHRD
jgi:hypothetical protein